MSIKILVIDDEESMCEILKFNLEREGYEVDTAYGAEEALEMDLEGYSLFIVDIMMGGMSGFDFAKQLRNITATEEKPILFCSALSDEDDVVKGLNIGADDYITKPFVIGEVLARVKAVLRRSSITEKSKQAMAESANMADYESDVVFKDLRIDRNDKECYLGGEQVTLTRTEFDILLFFLTHRNRIYSRESIIKNVWGDNMVVTGLTIDTNITRLRKKLGSYDKYIVTRQGFGYGFKEKD